MEKIVKNWKVILGILIAFFLIRGMFSPSVSDFVGNYEFTVQSWGSKCIFISSDGNVIYGVHDALGTVTDVDDDAITFIVNAGGFGSDMMKSESGYSQLRSETYMVLVPSEGKMYRLRDYKIKNTTRPDPTYVYPFKYIKSDKPM